MNIKSFIITLLLLTFISVNSIAQHKPEGPRKPLPIKDRIAHVMKNFNAKIKLSEKQRGEIQLVVKDFFVETDKLMKPGQMPDRSKIQTLEESRDTKIAEILTADQLKVYKTNKERIFPKPPHPEMKK